MRTAILISWCIAGAVLCGTAPADAVTITWKFLMHSSVAGKGPGPDGLIGTSDDTSFFGEKNTCNFTQDPGCEWTGSPTVGAYSFGAIEVPDGVANSCLFGDTPGQPCISGPCSPLGDYCPGDSAECIPCPQKKLTPDSFIFLGTEGLWPEEARMYLCQEYDGPGDPDPSDADGQTEFWIVGLQVPFTEPFLGVPSSSLILSDISLDPFLGGPCGVGETVSGSFDVYVAGVYPETFPMQFSGDLIDMDDPTPASCGYSLSDIDTLITNARSVDIEAEYLMILCGSAAIPNESTLPCMAGGGFDFVFVLYTTEDATQCPDNACYPPSP